MGNMNNQVKTTHNVMLTYDRIERVEVDIELDALRPFYRAGCLDEQFVKWIPERFAMSVKYFENDETAKSAAIEMCIRALYRTIPKSKVMNLEVWVDTKPSTQIG